MISEILYEDRVDEDIDSALDYYFSINQKLVEEFLYRLDEAKIKIINTPKGFETKINGCKTVLLQQFPYHLYYTIDDQKLLFLLYFMLKAVLKRLVKFKAVYS